MEDNVVNDTTQEITTPQIDTTTNTPTATPQIDTTTDISLSFGPLVDTPAPTPLDTATYSSNQENISNTHFESPYKK
jgi:hypothetical protein